MMYMKDKKKGMKMKDKKMYSKGVIKKAEEEAKKSPNKIKAKYPMVKKMMDKKMKKY